MPISQKQVRNLIFNSIAQAETEGRNGEYCVILEVNSIYKFIKYGSEYVIDHLRVLETSQGEESRWVSFAGEYSYVDIKNSILIKPSDYLIKEIDHTILINGSLNSVNISLPPSNGLEGKKYNIKCINDSFQCSVTPHGLETIDNENSPITLIQNESVTIQSDNTNWWII